MPGSLDDWVDKNNPVRALDAFVDALKLRDLGLKIDAAELGRPG